MSGEREFWFQVRDVAAQYGDAKSKAICIAFERFDGFNEVDFPVFSDYRGIAAEVNKFGFRNKHGRPYHQDTVRTDLIYRGLADYFFELKGISPSEEQREALYQAIVDGCCQRKHNSDPDDEQWLMRCSWRKLKRPVKRQVPWDRKK